ncbi:diguanylate cyclase domain-containing protein [Trujillonella endophytica]|uniref:Diguanylate cyclase (GGDEF) domain-containing protein n=1 Tax=Trujillonella endophytica TaxID=673521 RepID=A0A1H8WL48_9ACTN|nr:diguanylate cyclase [Trujillella endophytica]SEP28356.1 diguanylate cyclase (GGDEF) domain-containing protein [Trujillella endophytica]
MHSALVPPGALHHRVTAALSDWRLDDAEELLADIGCDASPYAACATPPDGADPTALATLGRAWADTLRAELLVRRLRMAGFTLVGDPVEPQAGEAAPPLDLHAGLAGLVDGAGHAGDAQAEPASHAALAIALVRSAKAAFDATDDDLQRAAGLARHARIELLSRRIDAAMDEAVEAASLLDPALPPTALLVDTLATLAGVLADLELMPLALDYQRRAHETALAAVAEPTAAGPAPAPIDDDALLVARAATRLGELCAELGEGLLDDGVPESAAPHFAEARRLAEDALALLPPEAADAVVAAQVVHGWALVGLGEHAAAAGPLRAAVRITSATGDRALLAAALLALGRALRRQGDGGGADEQLAKALALATEHGLPRLRRAALRELCTLHAELDDAGRALPYLQAYLADELDRVDERRTRWVELFGRRKSLLETERAAGQLRRQAYEDPLTHLPNRRYAEARLDGLIAAGATPALAVVDVDRFKSINDAIGHPGGDTVLRVVGDLLIEGCRDTDEVCRWAGDEFVVLLPDTTAEQAERALERIRRAVAAHDWTAQGLTRPVTISVGVASATRGDDRRTLFAAADGVLYDAKRSGRDRVVSLPAVTQRAAGPAGPAGPAAEPGDAPRTADPAPPAAAAPPVAAAPPADAVSPAAAAPPAGATGVAGGFAALLLEPTAADVPLSPARAEDPGVPLPTESAPAPARPAEPDVVWAPGRSTEQVLALVRRARGEHPDRPAVVVRAPAETLLALAAEFDGQTTVDATAMSAAVGALPEPEGQVVVLSAGGGDGTVAAEAAFAARVAGTDVVRLADLGGSRMHSGLPDPSVLAGADCLVVVAGLDASLAGLVAATTDVPVVAVPTSTGQPGSFGGFGALLTMLNSSTPGVVVSNIDNGHAAGVFAARIARRSRR